MTEQLLFDIEPEFSYCIEDARRHLRELNTATRWAILSAFSSQMEPLHSINDYYRHFSPWVSRTAFSNFMAKRKQISADRCLGILHSLSIVRVSNGMAPLELKGNDLECLLMERRLSLLRLLMTEWLSGTMNADMLSHHLPLYGQICNVLNLSESSPIVTQWEKETSGHGLVSTNGRPLFSEPTSTLRHSSQESF